MRKLLFILTLFTTSSLAQQADGINFQKGLSWLQIKEKAKKEKKYIFVDTYTTWCIPCKKMEVDIFPQKEVGDFFNNNFINFKVQIDRNQNDSYAIKNAYGDAKLIEETYHINSYPTYLFLNPEGVLVHYLNGISGSGKEFITKASEALNPITQYVNLKNEFKNGRRDTAFLNLLISVSDKTMDWTDRKIYVQSYLKSQENLLSSKNIRFIAQSVSSSKDIGYNILIDYPKEVNEVIGKQWRNDVINSVLFDEYILPVLRSGGKKITNHDGMMSYEGEINKNIDWNALEDSLQNKFKDRADRLLVDAKTIYYSWTEDWGGLNKTLLEYTSHDNNDIDVINNWLHYFAFFCNQNKYLSDVLVWASVVQSNNNTPIGIKNYGLVLYKVGKQQQAIDMLLRYQTLLPQSDESTTVLITKMKNGQKID
jgi:thioredoxin-related protein